MVSHSYCGSEINNRASSQGVVSIDVGSDHLALCILGCNIELVLLAGLHLVAASHGKTALVKQKCGPNSFPETLWCDNACELFKTGGDWACVGGNPHMSYRQFLVMA